VEQNIRKYNKNATLHVRMEEDRIGVALNELYRIGIAYIWGKD
jgi:hypothetical protein